MTDAAEPDFPLARTELRQLLRLSRTLHTASAPTRPQRLVDGLAVAFTADVGLYVQTPADLRVLATTAAPLQSIPVPLRIDADTVRSWTDEHPPSDTRQDAVGPSHRLVSNRRGEDRTSLLVCSREGPFGSDEAALLSVLHGEFAWLIHAAGSFAELPRENRVVLELLLTGMREKQIARRLERSPHTVHSHVKRLYRRFAVSSRVELLAKLARHDSDHVR